MINDFVGIGIVGVSLSIIIEAIKTKWGPTSNTTKGITVILSIILGTGYYFLAGTIWWQAVLGVLASASAFYAILLK
jgi:hypothetical protein